MAIVVYKCDLCQRKIELTQNKEGLEVTGRCIITDGCHGKLYQFDFIQDGIIGRLTPDVPGLNNFVARRILHTHEQTLSAQTWRIVHNLNTEPSVQTFIFVESGGVETLIETTPQAVITVSPNETQILFDTAVKGVAQLISRSTSTFAEEEDVVDPTATRQLTIGTEITIASLDSEPILSLGVQFFSPTTLEETSLLNFEFDDTPDPLSPWSGVNRVFIGGKLYTVRSTNVRTLIDGADIVNASPFIFTQINGVATVPENTVFILLSNFPHVVFDRDFDMLVDIASVTVANLSQGFFRQGIELFVFQSVVENIFPTIAIAD